MPSTSDVWQNIAARALLSNLADRGIRVTVTPVPLEYLVDGAQLARREGRVAFGSMVWPKFKQLDELRKGLPVDVYIYASHSQSSGPIEVSWHARYVGHVESLGGAHPEGMRYRPPSTAKDPTDNAGYWALFWEAETLTELPKAERLAVADLPAFGQRKPYGHPFFPEGPMLIEHP